VLNWKHKRHGRRRGNKRRQKIKSLLPCVNEIYLLLSYIEQRLSSNKKHDTICIYKKHPMYLSGWQRERSGRHAPSTKEGPSMSGKNKKKGVSTVDRKEERLSDETRKVPLDETKKGVHPYGKRGGPTLPLLDPTPD
jgi:hypothetical protein